MLEYNLFGVLTIHTRFDYLDLISRSQVCQNHKLQIDFSFLSTVHLKFALERESSEHFAVLVNVAIKHSRNFVVVRSYCLIAFSFVFISNDNCSEHTLSYSLIVQVLLFPQSCYQCLTVKTADDHTQATGFDKLT